VNDAAGRHVAGEALRGAAGRQPAAAQEAAVSNAVGRRVAGEALRGVTRSGKEAAW